MALSDAQLDAVLSQFESSDETISTDTLVSKLGRSPFNYRAPERILRDAIAEGFLYVDSIDRKGRTFVGLTDSGEHEWDQLEWDDEEEGGDE